MCTLKPGEKLTKRTGDYKCHYMASYLMNHYLRKYLINIWYVLLYRRHHTFDVKTCFQQNRYVFDVIVTSSALLVFCISWNFTHDISTVFEEIKHLRSRAPENIFYQIIKIDKTQILLKGGFFLFHEVLNFLKNDVNMFIYSKRLDDVWIFEKQSLSWKTMVCRQLYTNVR